MTILWLILKTEIMKKTLIYFVIVCLGMGCSSDKENSSLQDLVGKWKLQAFEDEISGTILTATDFENSNEITIEFKPDFNYVGSTVLNEFFGSYSIDESRNILIFRDFFTSEVNETKWGNLFYYNLRLNYNHTTQDWESRYEISDDVFKLYYSNSEYMRFEKL